MRERTKIGKNRPICTFIFIKECDRTFQTKERIEEQKLFQLKPSNGNCLLMYFEFTLFRVRRRPSVATAQGLLWSFD